MICKGCSPTTSFGIEAPFDEKTLLVTSPFLSPVVLGSIRLVLGIYTTGVLILALVEDSWTDEEATYLTYFTRLSYIGLCAYLYASATQTLSYAYQKRSGKRGYALQHWPKFLQFCHLYLTSSILTLPIIVTLTYWIVFDSVLDEHVDNFLTISQHVLNTLFILFEMLLTNVPPPRWAYMGPCVLILALYLALAYVTHATQGYYTYPFLDPAEQGPLLLAYIAGIGVGEVIVFTVVHWIMRLRVRLVSRFAPEDMGQKGPQPGERENENERMEGRDSNSDIELSTPRQY